MVHGSFAVVAGRFTVADPPHGSSAEAEVDATSFYTGHDSCDRHVHSKTFLDTETHPTIGFRSEFRCTGEAGTVLGMLTVRGTDAPAEITVADIRTSADSVVLNAEAQIDRYAHR
jgi:polyisoprenoid-binding protein YceI